MTPTDFETLAARADLCRLLAACYYEPGPEFMDEDVFGRLNATALQVDPGLAQIAQRLGPAFAAETAEDLLVDYARLFLGPIATRAQPYESVWSERADDAEPGAPPAILDLYADGGFTMDEDFRDLPDHIAAELEFLYALLFRAAKAARDGDLAELAAAHTLRQRLLAEHLTRWVGPFTDAIRAGAESDYYRDLADLTVAVIRYEATLR